LSPNTLLYSKKTQRRCGCPQQERRRKNATKKEDGAVRREQTLCAAPLRNAGIHQTTWRPSAPRRVEPTFVLLDKSRRGHTAALDQSQAEPAEEVQPPRAGQPIFSIDMELTYWFQVFLLFLTFFYFRLATKITRKLWMIYRFFSYLFYLWHGGAAFPRQIL